MLTGRVALLSVLVLVIAPTLSAQGVDGDRPMSAIDWLSNSIATPTAQPLPPGTTIEPPVAPGVVHQPITTMSIDGPSLDALGLVPVSATGLPRNLWGTSTSADLARLIRAEGVDTLPALQSLLMAVLVAELSPPIDSDGRGELFLARVDKLLDLGALDPALALLERIDEQQPETFRRWFDVALLLGEEDRACDLMRKTPEVAPTFPARVFCLARGGDWNAAALSLRTGETLGYVEPEMVPLLERFLDPELAEGAPDLPMPPRPSPLVLRLMEAIGQPLSTTTLPVAFAQSDLRSNAGWKTRLEAAERLARTGAIEPNRLLGLYTERRPAASGGVWERVKVVQTIDRALADEDRDGVARTLREAWEEMVESELEVPFATIFGSRLAGLGLEGETGRLAFRIGLLSPGYEAVARAHRPQGTDDRFLIGLALGDAERTTPPDQMGAAIHAAFLPGPSPDADSAALIEENRMGEALLQSIDRITEGARGDLREVTDGLALLRHVGLETTARRAALELVLLERRG
ncbi:hypothetical protein DEA8626_01413 [Defluviimonas aquaemixtae]|uniref:Uncharacterized protein n=1 Tax=Albidovulum aquaemixtae TaxID=1542388 RepID=A0A2R8B5L4_9RHOB|nr:hypothetical protein [Defluviimonas aquaemixtae]SPH17885.1 hypothetical protein DEA8626_01413 [Defluviimonas aquaemixtae]